MNTSLIKGIVAGAVVATAGGAIAGYRMMDPAEPPAPQFAEVISAVPVTETDEISREVCKEVEVVHQKEARDKHRVMGTATGAIVGGILGNQIGGGSGKTVATVVGAAAGGYAGNKVQEKVQSGDVYTTLETRCETVVEFQDRVVGYDVTYQIGDKEGQARMDADPGERIPLADGELLMDSVAPALRSS